MDKHNIAQCEILRYYCENDLDSSNQYIYYHQIGVFVACVESCCCFRFVHEGNPTEQRHSNVYCNSILEESNYCGVLVMMISRDVKILVSLVRMYTGGLLWFSRRYDTSAVSIDINVHYTRCVMWGGVSKNMPIDQPYRFPNGHQEEIFSKTIWHCKLTERISALIHPKVIFRLLVFFLVKICIFLKNSWATFFHFCREDSNDLSKSKWCISNGQSNIKMKDYEIFCLFIYIHVHVQSVCLVFAYKFLLSRK
jgi:hypothetical protein